MERLKQPGDKPDDPFGEPTVVWTHNWNGARCFSCERWSIWYVDAMVYPRARLGAPPNPDMPEEVQELYLEAAEVAVVSRRAGAALARAAMERLLKILDPVAPSKTRLDGYIERVYDKVSTSLARMLDVVRVTGNKALHVEDQPAELVLLALDDTEGPLLIENLLETANDLVDELITRPKRRDILWEKLPEGVKAKLSPASDS